MQCYYKNYYEIDIMILALDIGTVHFGPGSEAMNNSNPGIYARFNNGATGGVYFNSVRKVSSWAGYSMETPNKRFALTIGAVTGYQKAPVLPLVLISATQKFGGVTARASLITPTKFNVGGVHLSLERKI
jgi:hypothetical protein